MTVDPPCQRSVSTSTGMPVAISNCVLAYCVAHMAQRPKEQIKTVLLVNFTKDEILNAKKMIWETCQSKLDKLVQRVDTSVRGANADDILNALLKLQSTSDLPSIVLCASDIVRLPKYSPGELLEPSLAARLAVVEGQLLQLNDTVSCNATKRTLVEQKCDQLEKRMQNVAPTSKSRPAHKNAKSCEKISSHPTSPIHTIMSIFFFWFFFSFFIGYIYMFHNMLNYGMTDTMCNVQAVVRQEFIQLRYRITFIND